MNDPQSAHGLEVLVFGAPLDPLGEPSGSGADRAGPVAP